MAREEALHPALKSWLDNVIVPILVKDFVAAIKEKNRIASPPEIGIDSPRTGTASLKGRHLIYVRMLYEILDGQTDANLQ